MQNIRDFINWGSGREKQSLIRQCANWHQLCSCMDVIEDSELAIEKCVSGDLISTDDGMRYLILYGLLQALFIQQDAVNNLAKALSINNDYDPNKNQHLKHIRDIRNLSIGHPTKKRSGKSTIYSFIPRWSISCSRFTLIRHCSDGSENSEDVDVIGLIETQRKEHRRALKQVLDKLHEEDKNHKDEFKEIRLTDNFTTTNYALQKMFDAIESVSLQQLGCWGVDHLSDSIDNFVMALDEREEPHENFYYHINKSKYALERLKTYFEMNEESELTDEGAEIFTSFVGQQIKRLKEIAEEIDDTYNLQDNN